MPTREDYLRALKPLVRNDAVLPLVEVSLARILHAGRYPVHGLLAIHRTDLSHVVDWLEASMASEAHWLGRTDAQGRPRKLMKLGSLQQAVVEADKAMRIASQRNRSALGAEPFAGVEHVVDLPDGYSLVRLTSVEALDRESAFMGHCIGNGAYDGLLAADRFYSLVDRRGRPHATMHVDAGDAILQIKGRANEAILPKYARLILPWINENGLTLEEMPYACRLVTDEVGTIHCVDDLPEGCVLQGDIAFPGNSAFPRLPRDVEILGSLFAQHREIAALPEGLKVRGDLILRGATIDELPDRIEVGGDLDVSETPVRRLPGTFRIGGTMRFDGSGLVELPDDLVVHGDLSLRNTSLARLPRNLRVEKFLVLSQGSVEEIGADVSVAGRIDLASSAIRRLPENFHVREDLDLSFTEIDALPEGLVVDGNLVMRHCTVRSLPKDLRIRGGLVASRSRLKDLPAGLGIGSHVDLSDTFLERLPDGMCVGGMLALNGTRIRELPADLEVGGAISLPDGFDGDTRDLEIAGRPPARTP